MDDPTTVLQSLVQQQQRKEQEQALAVALQLQNQKQQKQGQSSQEQQPRPQQELEHLHQEQHEFAHNDSEHEPIHLDMTMTKSNETTQATPNDKTNEQLLLSHTASQLLEHNGHLVDESGSVTQILQDQDNQTLASSPTSRASSNSAPNPAVSSNTFFLKNKKTITSLETLDSAMASAVAAASSTINASAVPCPPTPPPVPGSAAAVAAISKSGALSNSMAASHPSSLDSYNRYDKCPTIIKWPANDWEAWLEKERTNCRWNMIRHRHRDKQTFARGPTASEWIREFQCDHAGQYRDRKNPNIDPSKKRKRAGSIKCNCPAFIKMRKQFQEDEVVIEYFWRHEGHIPDVMEDIKAQRLPLDLKAWIKRRVNEGHDWKTVKHMMTSESPLLDELHPATKQNIRILLQASYAQYANTSRQAKNKRETRSPSSQRSDGGNGGGSSLNHPGRREEEISLAQHHPHHSSPRSSQKQISPSVPDQKDTIGAQTAWQLVSLNLSSDSIQTNHSSRDSQTLAVHNLPSSSSTDDRAARDELKRQALALGETLLNAEAISRVIHEQVGVQEVADSRGIAGAQEMTALSLVGTAVDGTIDQSTATTSENQDSTNPAASNGQSSLFSNNLQETVESSLQSNSLDQSGVTERLAEHSGSEQAPEGQQQQTTLQQEQEQLRQPRDMMLQMLRAIAELHKQMEMTEEYGTQEDAIHIIESFALPIRLMKEALERRSGNS
ncbi:hypothetical protein BGX26_007780 [Mortierella sp. AD094]|nr:hypothetical protein BGX26_007780 [Mortierella sp. AD094]